MATGKLFVISGPSGTGKGTICREILNTDDSIKLSVSMTTRSPREGERDKVHYYFVDHDFFNGLIDRGGFLEYAGVYGNFYGTPKKEVLEWLDSGTDVILEIDVQGALQVKRSYPEAILIFILPPSMKELRNRMIGRGSETEETLNRRLGAAYDEIAKIGSYDYKVVNDRLDEAVDRVRAVITAERCRVDEKETDSIVGVYKEEF